MKDSPLWAKVFWLCHKNKIWNLEIVKDIRGFVSQLPYFIDKETKDQRLNDC